MEISKKMGEHRSQIFKKIRKQILRIFGISKIIIESNFFPISSSVYFNRKLLKLCKK